MSNNKVHIKQRGNITRVFIDGIEIRELKYIRYRNSINEVPTIKLEFCTNEVDIDVDRSDTDTDEEVKYHWEKATK